MCELKEYPQMHCVGHPDRTAYHLRQEAIPPPPYETLDTEKLCHLVVQVDPMWLGGFIQERLVIRSFPIVHAPNLRRAVIRYHAG